ncbi:glutamine amidotransferase family protein [Candidatus Sumerlaeota bacterium]|nr:glutamine amidotransferase family protein [Candidatus Sumerlaeota bacterium]
MREISGCGHIGIFDQSGKLYDGELVMRAIAAMHERGNGLGGGFAVYGCYPEYRDYYAFHLIFDDEHVRKEAESFLEEKFFIEYAEPIPVEQSKRLYTEKSSGINPEEERPEIVPPLLWRYFAKTQKSDSEKHISDDDYVVSMVMHINEKIDGAYVISSGKNMGVFKGVGYAEDLAEFFKIADYRGYAWVGHTRFPTNTPGWWGGAHPFTLLDWAVTHNGEISSYGINKRHLEMFGYKCTLMTDTEVMTYILDLLIRRHKLPIEIALKAVAPPFWKNIDRMPDEERELIKALRMVYGSLMVNGPFAIIFAWSRGMVGINDRIKLRPMVAGVKGERVFISSEESAIREICPEPDRVWNPRAGQPVIAELKEEPEYAVSRK